MTPQVKRVIDQLNEELLESTKASPIIGRDGDALQPIEMQFKVESLENTLRYLPYRKKDALIWELIGIVDGRVRVPRKIKKLGTMQINERIYRIKLKRILQIERELPNSSNYFFLAGREKIRLGCKYLIPPHHE